MLLLLKNVNCSVLQDCIQGYEWPLTQQLSSCRRCYTSLCPLCPVVSDEWPWTQIWICRCYATTYYMECKSVLQGRCSGHPSGTLEAVLPKVTLILDSTDVAPFCRAAPVALSCVNNLYECYFMSSGKINVPSTLWVLFLYYSFKKELLSMLPLQAAMSNGNQDEHPWYSWFLLLLYWCQWSRPLIS